MKLLSALVISAFALTDDEMAAFKCRDASYAQYDMVDTNGGAEVNDYASSKYCLLSIEFPGKFSHPKIISE